MDSAHPSTATKACSKTSWPARRPLREVVFGERRLRCAWADGHTEVPATIRHLDDPEARVPTVTEDLQRKKLHVLEEAAAIAGLFAQGWTLDTVASRLGRPRSWAARRKHRLNLTLSWSQPGWRASGRRSRTGCRATAGARPPTPGATARSV